MAEERPNVFLTLLKRGKRDRDAVQPVVEVAAEHATLDEIGELSPAAQATLLRVLETGELRPVGRDDLRKIDVRLVAATTSEEVASTQMDATDPDCPMLVVFDEGDPIEEQYAEPTDELTAWLVEYVET